MTLPLSAYIEVNITAGTKSVDQTGFGIPMLMGFVPVATFATRTRTYTAATMLDQMITDGFNTYDPLYLMAQATLLQNPRPPTIIIGRTSTAPVFAYSLVVQTTTEVISVTIDGAGVGAETFSTTGTGFPIADAGTLVALINAGTLGAAPGAARILAANGGTATITIVPGANPLVGLLINFEDMDYNTMVFNDDQVTPNAAAVIADLALIRAADDTWWWWLYEGSGALQLEQVALSANTIEKAAVGFSQDHDIPIGTAGNLAEDLEAASYGRFCLFYKLNDGFERLDSGTVGQLAPKTVGGWAAGWKVVVGSTGETTYIGSDKTAFDLNNCNYYANIAGTSMIQGGGILPDGSFLDLLQLTDWLRARIREALANILLNNDKVPYTDKAGDMGITAIQSVYEEGADAGGFILSDFTGDYLAAASQTAGDRAIRLFNGLEFGGTFTGAVNAYRVNGRVTS